MAGTKTQNSNIVPLNTERDAYNCLRDTVTDLNKILDYIDDDHGRNDALRAYIYALRDRQRAIDLCSIDGARDPAEVIHEAHEAVNDAFRRLIVAEYLIEDLWLIEAPPAAL
jgi:hypothetical protein